ncbi:hypothetical protein SAMN05216439_1373 [Methanobrevibacter gottschalkii]|uniref:Uncharacterized protein n=2 Tax=Methanobrevibacter gottschalkii TaxID=190974 RepID=A0A3N5C0A7_9EURY|nr:MULTISPECIES: DUF2098 family protein [Methanobrevibacter]MCQ2970989.1 DUF2098 domain-containing protein [archaeon]OEC96826.1 hypothetical protein A9505_06280 [Methanobrevibacter sp. A27]RPF51545.1 hypothetical protein EDC42_0875 [Methanobrevibacter gottschalkii DSM 11977]SEK71535.1 hypothetical protein SAMN05216439_1373 [Methanobrevibacter gottschalkii]
MVFDARDIEIPLNSHVRYVDTGTMGEVVDERITDGIGWVKLGKTGLWYKSSHVELLAEKDIKKSSWGAGKDLDVEDLKEKAISFEELELSSDAGNGGG